MGSKRENKMMMVFLFKYCDVSVYYFAFKLLFSPQQLQAKKNASEKT